MTVNIGGNDANACIRLAEELIVLNLLLNFTAGLGTNKSVEPAALIMNWSEGWSVPANRAVVTAFRGAFFASGWSRIVHPATAA